MLLTSRSWRRCLGSATRLYRRDRPVARFIGGKDTEVIPCRLTQLAHLVCLTSTLIYRLKAAPTNHHAIVLIAMSLFRETFKFLRNGKLHMNLKAPNPGPDWFQNCHPYLQGSFIWSTSIPSGINLPVQTPAPTAIQWSVSFNYPSY